MYSLTLVSHRMTFPYILSLNHLIEGQTDETVPSTDSADIGSPVDFNSSHLESSAGDASSPGLHENDPDEGIKLHVKLIFLLVWGFFIDVGWFIVVFFIVFFYVTVDIKVRNNNINN